MADTKEDVKPDGAAFDDYFESLGKKAEHLSVRDQPTNPTASHATSAITPQSTDAGPVIEDEDDQKVVDEIESLCMNCHENVYRLECSWMLSFS